MSTDIASGAMAPVVIHGVRGLRDRLGTELGVSDWIPVRQEDVTAFAKLTGDEQWIHVDPQRAKGGPFGTTVAHGFLTLSRSTGLLFSLFTVDDVDMILNYGLNRVRFPAPVRVGSRIRMRVTLAEASAVPGGIQVVYRLEYEVEGEPKPPCIADLVFRYYASAAEQEPDGEPVVAADQVRVPDRAASGPAAEPVTAEDRGATGE
jgi:acyl dehydratase